MHSGNCLYISHHLWVQQTPKKTYLHIEIPLCINEKEKDLSINANLEGDAQIIGETSNGI